MPVLAEIKVRSPKEGDLLRGRTPGRVRAHVCSRPIAGISIVTEPLDFGGSVASSGAWPASSTPDLRKDFIREARGMEERPTPVPRPCLTVRARPSCSRDARRGPGVRPGDARRGPRRTSSSAPGPRRSRRHPGINNRNILVGETDDGDVR